MRGALCFIPTTERTLTVTEMRERTPRIETASYWAWVVKQGTRRASILRTGLPGAPWCAVIHFGPEKFWRMRVRTHAEAIAWVDRWVRK